ncbi:sequestosome-1 isoform X3 [Rhipicephalus microplus]|uniref:sequestosome-1 isoform X3 n=1 Tax=Rhipicephalus microplus TaxID=6941 RepID=UPI003F6D178A
MRKESGGEEYTQTGRHVCIMAVTIKAYLEGGEIRRFVIEDLRDYRTLHDRVKAAFPILAGNMKFTISWKDPEGDEIVMSSDAELAQALLNMKDGLLRIYVTVDNPWERGGAAPCTSTEAVHAGVVCDTCDQEIRGVRYKCLQCENYDLCGPCHGRKVHEEHDLLKLVNPGIRPLWSFPGWKRLWRHCGYPRRGGCPAPGGSHRFAHRPDQRQHPQDFLRGIGDTVANLLEPFGITVDVASSTSPKKDSATEPMDTSAAGRGCESHSAEPLVPAAANGSSSVQGGPFTETNRGGEEAASEPAAEVEVPSGWTLLNVLRDSHLGDDLPRSMSLAAQAGDKPVDTALGQMLAMGFNNEGGWLRQLLEVKHGDIGAVLESLHPSPK